MATGYEPGDGARIRGTTNRRLALPSDLAFPTMTTWDAARYLQYADERTRPARELLARVLAALAPDGVLAFQVPDNLAEPSHRLMRELAGPWSASVATVPPRAPIASPSRYYDVLMAASAVRVDVWRTTDELVMASPAAIVDWVRGTGLRPFLEAVPSELHDGYLAAYTAAIDAAYPARPDGARLFGFPRRYVVATRGPLSPACSTPRASGSAWSG